jgi:hypothetical protein
VAEGLASNFVIYQPQFWGGVIEVLQRETGVFNEASAGTLVMEGRFIKGNYEQASFLKYTSGLVNRRVTTDNTTSLTDINLQMGEFVGVKLNRVVGPVAMARDPYKKAGFDPKVFSVQLGQQLAPEIMADYCDSMITAVKAGITGVSSLVLDITGAGTTLPLANTFTHARFPQLYVKFGDRASRLKAIVMHSKVYYDLMGNAIQEKIVNVADVTIAQGTTATMGKPVVICDSPSLFTVDASGNPNAYFTLLLVEGAGKLTESEARDAEMVPIVGHYNLGNRFQAEHAFNLDVKGCAWDIANGGANPTQTALGTSTNWDKVVADTKMMPGVALKSL